ncbi:MAG: hypothetical protein JXR71_02845 [Bacteroidales bacterium]|nr:hypothetical protein [Bacteroidales bacterium]
MTTPIPDIYLYCDRWCERCAFASRCEACHVDDTVLRSEPLSFYDQKNKEFWLSLEANYPAVVESVQRVAIDQKQNLDEFEGMRVRSGYNLFHAKVIKNPLLSAGRTYEDTVDDWLDQQSEQGILQMQDFIPGSVFQYVSETISPEEKEHVNHWIEVIMRYQLQLFLKLSRTFYIQSKEEEGGTQAEGLPASKGSAKTALVMMQRSLVSWFLVKDYFSDKAGIENIMLHLYRMIRRLEADFPDVMKFIRTGLDE